MAITLDGTTGITTPGLTNTGTETVVNLTTTGNTTLGDATSDTLTVGVTGIVKDASGNVGIGTATPRTSKLDVMSATGTQNTNADNPGLVNITGPNGTNGSQPILVLATNDAMAANIGPAITFQARYITSSTAAATLGFIQCIKENATSGNLQGALIFTPRNSAGNFAEAMRIDSSGNLLVGATDAFTGNRFYASGSALGGSGVLGVRSNTAVDVSFPVGFFSKFDNNSTTSQVFLRFAINNNTQASGQINANGVNAAAFGSWSDRRLKENITELPSQLANIMALRPIEFDYIESEGGGHQIGFIAQEVQEIYPDLVGERADGMLTLSDMNKNDARLIKAIQEQQAIITALTARITALETP